MITREIIEQMEDRGLAPYAVRASRSRGRVMPEPEHPYRTCFARDRDRIIHSRAFRRLEYKTQVFVNSEGDHYRTRLTHTLEVAYISRTVARALGLNEDLAEAIALAHDIGHPPFGHSGEEALRELMKNRGGFEHNLHGLRLVDVLESHTPGRPGLNLTYEVRESFAKHFTSYDTPDDRAVTRENLGLKAGESMSLEGQLCMMTDEIAYDSHDIDDGLRAGILNDDGLMELQLWRRAREQLAGRLADAQKPEIIRMTVRKLIGILVTDLIAETESRIASHGIQTLDDVRAFPDNLVGFSGDIQTLKVTLGKYLFDNFYKNPRVVGMLENARRILMDLFGAYISDYGLLPPTYREKIAESGDGHLVVCDYIAGMTDRFAIEEHHRLFNPVV